MPELVHEKCLEEYKKIVSNAAKNYNQLQKSVTNWHKTLEKTMTECSNGLAYLPF